MTRMEPPRSSSTETQQNENEQENGMDPVIEQFRAVDFDAGTWTVGAYLAYRLQEAGCADVFAVPGDFNMPLLDELLKNRNVRVRNCCNELNAGFAADGYARAKV